MTIKKAKFITIEGIEGVGKSTCLKYICDFLQEQKIQFIQTREPGGTAIAESIRQVMLDHYSESMSHDTELLLAFAGRAQHLQTVIRPSLQANQWVVCDRFTDATYAYQGGGRGIAKERIQYIEQWVHPDLQPDLTLLLFAPVQIALERAKGRGALDRIELEKTAFFERVQETYLQLAKEHSNRFRIVDASENSQIVKQKVLNIIAECVK